MKCDFCSAENVPLHDISCKTHILSAAGIEFATSVDNWAACQDCAALIDADERDALANRCLAAFGDDYLPDTPREEVLDMLKQIHAAFFACRSEEFAA